MDPPRPPEKQPDRVVNVSEAEAVRLSGEAGNPRIWEIRWKKAQLEYADDMHFGGTMDTVTGTIYHEGEAVSDFRADSGRAEKESERLTLDGNVRITARKGGGVLTCESLEWLPSRRLVAAKGKVRFEDDVYEAGTFSELWATPEMDAIGTPDRFGGKDE